MRRLLIMVVWLLVGLSGVAGAVDIQYLLSNGQVQVASDTPIDSTEGYGIVTLTGSTAVQIVWPVPTGCAVGTGKPSFTVITDPPAVTVAGAGMAVRPGLIVFYTTSPLLPGCFEVATKRQVKTLMDQAIVAAANSLDTLIQALAGVNTWKLELCPPTNNNANCIAWRSASDTVNARYPSRVQGAALAADMATLVNEGYGFIDTQCKAAPGGGFC